MQTLLIVDDDANLRRLFCKTFKNKYKVLAAKNGYQALNTVTTNKVDIVMLDYHMPGIDGIETLKGIKQLDDKIPVIIVTCDTSKGLPAKAKNLGASGYIPKPFAPDDIVTIVSCVLNEK